MKSKIKFSLALLFLVNLCLGQNQTWKLNTEESYISYDAKHVLHAWTGTNTSIKGVAKLYTQNNEIKENNQGRAYKRIEKW